MSGQVDKKTVIKDLLEQGKQKGSLSNQEILDAIGEMVHGLVQWLDMNLILLISNLQGCC